MLPNSFLIVYLYSLHIYKYFLPIEKVNTIKNKSFVLVVVIVYYSDLVSPSRAHKFNSMCILLF